MRYTIIKGICNGLKYLHEELKPPIFHLDLKPSNILLDKNMIPKIADFGLSRFFNEEKSHITNSPIGTFGYLPPEFINQNIISNKLDIFSLGVVIIKIVAGPTGYSRSAEMTSEQFAEIVHGNWRSRLQAAAAGDLLELYSEQVKSCIKIALSCVEADRRRRPTIGDIVNMLTDTETLENYHGAKGGATLGTNWASARLAEEKSGKEDRKTGPKNQVLSAVPVYGPADNRPVAPPLHGALIDQVQEEKQMDDPVSSSTMIREAMTMKQVQNLFTAVEPLLPRVVRDGIQACIQRSSPETPAGAADLHRQQDRGRERRAASGDPRRRGHQLALRRAPAVHPRRAGAALRGLPLGRPRGLDSRQVRPGHRPGARREAPAPHRRGQPHHAGRAHSRERAPVHRQLLLCPLRQVPHRRTRGAGQLRWRQGR